MPGSSHSGPLPPLSPDQMTLAKNLKFHVYALAEDIGERNIHHAPAALDQAAAYVERTFAEGGFGAASQVFTAGGKEVRNIEVELDGRDLDEIVVIGAHYDSAPGTPGANDNGTGTAAVLELARLLEGRQFRRTVKLVAFVNEEPPWFKTEKMGSKVWAKAAAERGDNVVAMLSLETIGYYRDEPGTQPYPPPMSWFYPDTGNFIGFVGNVGNRSLVQRSVGAFRQGAKFPSEGAYLPSSITGVDWSDHWSFWQHGFPGIMVTDTAVFRYPHYHLATDTPDKVDYQRLARVVDGLVPVIEELADR